jgi:hypothetical protein
MRTVFARLELCYSFFYSAFQEEIVYLLKDCYLFSITNLLLLLHHILFPFLLLAETLVGVQFSSVLRGNHFIATVY